MMEPYKYSPDLYIEITSNAFKSSPNQVLQQSYLHDSWYTKKVYRIQPFEAGIYLLFNLHRNPHYHLPVSMREKFDVSAKKKSIPTVDISEQFSIYPNELYHYSSHSSLFRNKISPLLDKLHLSEIIMLLDNKSVCNRGNIAHNIGWHTLNFEFQGQINIPSHSNITDLDKSTLKILTK